MLEDIKRVAEDVIGLRKPSREELDGLVRAKEPKIFRFEDDGFIPNHPAWPVLLYLSAVRLPLNRDPAAVFEVLFESNGWGDTWRGGIYDFVHYHSRIHEALAVARGTARLQFGGPFGKVITVKAGDVAVLPAGTGHQCLSASKTFLAVGAYPPSGAYDECKNVELRKYAKLTIPKTPRPEHDPIHGSDGPLLDLWKRRKRASR
ncbi:MAG TPA: cupin domain-containing protein [Xanthobacteraceae bacterium]